jgi:acyl-ACP thioesterase
MAEADWVPRPVTGRIFLSRRRVRLGDAGVDARLRLDALARLLQDVANEDWAEAGGSTDETWVVRRTSIRRVTTARWPLLGDTVDLATWCGGVGAAWAERRTTLSVGESPAFEASALWVPVDDSGHPHRLRESFFEIYGEASARRKVSGRVGSPAPDDRAERRPWTLRRADLDVVGHVNNAALWQAVVEVCPSEVARVTVTHHGSLDPDDAVELWLAPPRAWLVVRGEARVSVEWDGD